MPVKYPTRGTGGGGGGAVTVAVGTNVGDVLALTGATEVGAVGTGSANSVPIWGSADTLQANVNFIRDPNTGIVTNVQGFQTDTTPSTVTRFVDVVNGNDANTGLSAGAGNAWQTLAFALAQIPLLGPGDIVINLADGTYPETIVARDYYGPALSSTYGSSKISIVGNAATPANVVLSSGSTIFSLTNVNSSYLFNGITFLGTGANTGISAQRSNIFVQNCNFTDCGTAISLSQQSRGTWLASTAGGIITSPVNAFTTANQSFLLFLSGLTITGITGTCFQASNFSLLGFAGGGTWNMTGNGATSFVSAGSGGHINMSTSMTINLDDFSEPIRITNGGIFQDNPNNTWNMNDCGCIARITENSRFLGATSGVTTYNLTGTTPATVRKGDLAFISSTFIPQFWYEYLQSADNNFGCDFRYRVTQTARHLGTIPTGVTRYFSGDQLQSQILPLMICDRSPAYIDELRVASRIGNGAAHTDTYTVLVNGVATGVTGTITNGSSLVVTSALAGLAAGDAIGLQVDSDAASTAEDIFVQIKMRYT